MTSAELPGSPPPSPLASAIGISVSILSLLYPALVAFPGGFHSARPGLDPSWVYAINWIPVSPYRFGRDVNFTYGPLGFLFYPIDIGEHVLFAALFRVFVSVSFAAVLFLLRATPIALCASGLLYGMASWLGNPIELHLLVVIGLW